MIPLFRFQQDIKGFLRRNSFKYSKIKGDSALELVLKASARCWEMIEDALMSAGEGRCNRPVARMQSLFSRDSGGTLELSWSEESEELDSWSILGMGPAVHASFLWLSAFWAICCWWTLSLHPGKHWRGAPRHLDFSGDPVNLGVVLPKPRMSQDQFLLA